MMSDSGRLEAIWIKRASYGPMDACHRAVLEAGRGLVGNSNRGGRRQVTLIDSQAWAEALQDLQGQVDPASRRANLMLGGIRLFQTRGKVLKIGGCILRILGETRPCERMDEAFQGLKAALESHWRGGVFAEVLQGGTIRIGDAACWEDQ